MKDCFVYHLAELGGVERILIETVEVIRAPRVECLRASTCHSMPDGTGNSTFGKSAKVRPVHTDLRTSNSS
jgi:hypothetical protein